MWWKSDVTDVNPARIRKVIQFQWGSEILFYLTHFINALTQISILAQVIHERRMVVKIIDQWEERWRYFEPRKLQDLPIFWDLSLASSLLLSSLQFSTVLGYTLGFFIIGYVRWAGHSRNAILPTIEVFLVHQLKRHFL